MRVVRRLSDCDQANRPTYAIPADLLALLHDVGPRLPELWNSNLLSTAEKKRLLRSLIDKVVLNRSSPEYVTIRVVWRGGATTSTDMPVAVGNVAWMSGAKEMEQTIIKMARAGESDQVIAEQLTKEGYRSPRSEVVLPRTVATIRCKHRILRREAKSRQLDGYVSAAQLATQLGVSEKWIYRRIEKKMIAIEKDEQTRSYQFPDNPNTIKELRMLIDGQTQSCYFSGASR